MPQSEMEALLQLQKETIESLRQLVESQRLTIEQMAKSHEEQTAQLNQTIEPERNGRVPEEKTVFIIQ